MPKEYGSVEDAHVIIQEYGLFSGEFAEFASHIPRTVVFEHPYATLETFISFSKSENTVLGFRNFPQEIAEVVKLLEELRDQNIFTVIAEKPEHFFQYPPVSSYPTLTGLASFSVNAREVGFGPTWIGALKDYWIARGIDFSTMQGDFVTKAYSTHHTLPWGMLFARSSAQRCFVLSNNTTVAQLPKEISAGLLKKRNITSAIISWI